MASDPNASDADLLSSFAHPEALRQPERVIAAYFNSTTVGLCVIDSDLRYIAINKKLAEINGLPAPDHLGKTVREVLGDFADTLEAQFRHILATGEAVNIEVSGKLPSTGEIGHWIVHYLPIKNEAGKATRIGAVVVEITAQRKLEQSLQHVGGKLRQETRRLRMLSDVTDLLSSNWDIPKVFPKISARIRRLLRQEFASFALHDPGTGLLVHQATDFPLGKGLFSAVQVSTGNTPAGRSIQERAPMVFTKEQLHGFEGEVAKSLLAEGLQSLCCVPLLRPKGPLGVFVLGSTRRDAFQSEDVALVNQVAAQLAVAIENHRTASEVELLRRRLGEERSYLEGETRPEGSFSEIVGDSPAIRRVFDQVTTVASSEATVLILGETGTGKELIARAIHRLSRRAEGAFIKVNCAAIPTGLLESELFGHEKGAFTGAVSRKIGRMELADGGTLLLDEIGEIPLELQPKLLRVLQDHEFERLGSTHTIKVNLRLLAATNRNLSESVSQHEFRSDLFYRLNVFPIRVPSLHERREDIPLLIRHFVHKFARRMDRQIETIPKETMKALMSWDWPGNVRELENLMERSVILSEGNTLRVPLAEMHSQGDSQTGKDHTLDTAERLHIIRVLRETKGILSGPEGAARRLGLKRTTLQSKMQRLNITRQDYSDSSQK
ncbi:MAG TPA: sigma 54-interacting transcriptional regulator [Candidatus Dormibacteraeota bacterium]|nr:sigma 54-interacting transcriptional regulator [Candidatus Dormibacteraeota bacterium]